MTISCTVLRHAKSGWDDPLASDFDRPLTDRGQAAARAMGAWTAAEALTFDLAIASPARRVRETIAAVGEGSGRDLDVRFEERLYMATASALLDIVRAQGGGQARLLLVGHNPGLEELVLDLAAAGALRNAVAEKYPTGALAEIHFEAADWSAIRPGSGRLVRFVRPRDLDAAVGRAVGRAAGRAPGPLAA